MVTWPDRGQRPRSGQVTESDKSRGPHILVLTSYVVISIVLLNSEYNHRRINVIFLQDKHNINVVYLNLIHIHLLF
jgi:hypothetical protein